MSAASEAVARVRARIESAEGFSSVVTGREIYVPLSDLRAILADHARLTEQVEVAREGIKEAIECLSVDAPISAKAVLRETLTRMEKNDD